MNETIYLGIAHKYGIMPDTKEHRIGIDFSITSPAVTILAPDGNFTSMWWTKVKKYATKFSNGQGNFIGYELFKPCGANNADVSLSYLENAWSIVNAIKTELELYVCAAGNVCFLRDNIKIAFENYSFGSQNKAFYIAEATAALKYVLLENTSAEAWDVVPPQTVRKQVIGNGRAKKEEVVEWFIAETGVDIVSLLGASRPGMSPVTDIADSYAVATYLKQKEDK